MKRFAVLSLIIFTAHLSAFGQQPANATLTGMITDPHGAAVPGVKITATQTATGLRRDTVSNEDGLYVFSNMSPGDYELRLEAKGFTTRVSKTSVSLKVGQTVTLDVPLDIGLNESMIVDLTSYVPLIDNSDSLIHGIIESREV